MPYITPKPDESVQQWAERRVRETGQSYVITNGGKAFFDCEENRYLLEVHLGEKVVQVVKPQYVYRGLPCSIRPENLLWEVSGQDIALNSGGVLEWCYDEEDAKQMFDKMSQHPDRFRNLKYQAYKPVA